LAGATLTNNPVRDVRRDLFGRGGFATAVAGLVREHAHDELIVIGIEGAWGTGKSSVLGMAATELISDGRHREVGVSAWRAPSRDQFLANLSYGMVTALKRDWQSSYFRVAWARLSRQSTPALVTLVLPILTLAMLIALPEVRTWTKSVVETKPEKLAAGLGLFGVPILTFLFSRISQPVLDGAKTMFGKASLDGVGALERFAHDFDVLGAGQAKGSRFIVLVEDLDRCSPAQVTDVLSAIAQLSSHPKAGRLAFLLAYDRKVLLKSIAQDAAKGADGISTPAAAEDYLFRVVHVELALPEIETSAVVRRAPARTPRLNAMATAILVSAAAVGAATWCIAAVPASTVAAVVVAGCVVGLFAEPVISLVRRSRAKVGLPPDWPNAVVHAGPWLPSVPRRRTHVLTRARVAMLMSPEAGLTSWQALSTAALADRHPTAIDATALSVALGRGALDPARDFLSEPFGQDHDAMKVKGLDVDHFTDPAKLLAVVRWAPRATG
jgi:hypothetical protein